MDLAQRDKLSELVEELTTSGQQQLNQEKIKEIKKICKISNDYVDHVYYSVMAQLDKEHAEIRLSAFQIASELFSRSHQFRIRLVDNFQEFLELTVETDSDQPLPPPKEVAKKLKISAIKTIQSWQATYGSAYKKLALGYHFLKQVKNVDFNDIQARTVAERSRENERQRRMERIYRDRVETAAREMEESYEEIETTVTEMKSCLELLLPDEFGLSEQTAARVPNSRSLGEAALVVLEQASRHRSEDEPPWSSQEMEMEENRGTNERIGEEDEKKCLDPGMEENPLPETIESAVTEERALQTKQDCEEKEVDRDEEETEMNDVPYEDVFIRNSGLISHSYTLNINVEPDVQVKETEDNEAVVSTLIDIHRLITTKHLPVVQSWVQVFTKSGPEQQQLLRRALHLKMTLESLLKKEKLLHIDYKTRIRKVTRATAEGEEDDEDEDEDDFEEVPEKEGFEPHIPDHLREEYGLEPSPSTSAAPTNQKAPTKRPAPWVSPPTSPPFTAREMRRRLEEESDPTSAAATLHLLKGLMPPCTGPGTGVPSEPPSTAEGSNVAGSTSRVGDKAPDAPIVPFGLDLYYWGQKQPSAGKIIKSTSQHRFWVPCEVDEETENQEVLAESRSRYISFPGTFTPVSHHCNAPLGNGKLCPRQDRVKCPFHGVIVPRDADGQPSRAEDRAREAREDRRRREMHPDWQDVELMQDIEAATGEDLGSQRLLGKGKGRGKGKGKSKQKYPNLSDLKKNADTSRSRLENKVFNKSSMRRVTAVMTKIDSRKHEKFSNQFNYALN